jgi:hypothetical protein
MAHAAAEPGVKEHAPPGGGIVLRIADKNGTRLLPLALGQVMVAPGTAPTDALLAPPLADDPVHLVAQLAQLVGGKQTADAHVAVALIAL